MASTTRLWTLALIGAVALAIGACATPEVQECGNTQTLCPQGFHCAAAQGICIKNTQTCGDAHLDADEICDDGNNVDGDGCSADCKSDETCGNHIIDHAAGEICDDGNTRDGDGCSHDCKSMEICGNHIVDFGEACDDGNTRDGDGCSHDCKSTESCGNGIVDKSVGEVCDPPEAGKCSANCRSLLTCGNKTIDDGEECDDGLDGNGDDKDCRSDCQINRCGDGRINLNGSHHEECDDGPKSEDGIDTAIPTETSNCNINCTKPKCGDGVVNIHFKPDGTHPEQCDNITLDNDNHVVSLNTDDRDCTAACQVNVCGDHLTNSVGPAHREDCDDGDRDDTNACTNECKNKACGDGILGPGEQCDDHNTQDNDGCSHDCKKEFCGDGTTNNVTETCDPPNTATCNFNCKTASCGDGIVNPLFKKDGVHGEECDPPNPGHGCSDNCTFELCGNGIVDSAAGEDCDDGPNDLPGNGCFHCHFEKCGNGILDLNEECDDGNNVATDACVSNNITPNKCKIARCGDGVTWAGVEDCDDGSDPVTGNGGTHNTHCSATCQLVSCGNGVLEQGEECDDGNQADNDDCLSSGTTAATKCKIARCGDGKIDAKNEQCDDGDDGGHGHGNGTLSSTCSTTCQLIACGNGVLEQGEECDDGNNVATDACVSNNPDPHTCKVARCGDGVTEEDVEDCDDGPLDNLHQHGNGGSLSTCSAVCHAVRCGNGEVEQGEDCDLGDGHNTDSCQYGASSCLVCSTHCKSVTATGAFCGDGHVDLVPAPGHNEVCDHGNLTCGACSPDCAAETLAAATGAIEVPAASAISDGDAFVLNDGTNVVIFEFKKIVPPPDDQLAPVLDFFTINIDADADSAAVAAFVVQKIIAANLKIDAVVDVAVGPRTRVKLTHQVETSLGNEAISGAFDDATGFRLTGMSGGLGGNCSAGLTCVVDEDCASQHCGSNHHCL